MTTFLLCFLTFYIGIILGISFYIHTIFGSGLLSSLIEAFRFVVFFDENHKDNIYKQFKLAAKNWKPNE